MDIANFFRREVAHISPQRQGARRRICKLTREAVLWRFSKHDNYTSSSWQTCDNKYRYSITLRIWWNTKSIWLNDDIIIMILYWSLGIWNFCTSRLVYSRIGQYASIYRKSSICSAQCQTFILPWILKWTLIRIYSSTMQTRHAQVLILSTRNAKGSFPVNNNVLTF